jgi:hypothetical protein
MNMLAASKAEAEHLALAPRDARRDARDDDDTVDGVRDVLDDDDDDDDALAMRASVACETLTTWCDMVNDGRARRGLKKARIWLQWLSVYWWARLRARAVNVAVNYPRTTTAPERVWYLTPCVGLYFSLRTCKVSILMPDTDAPETLNEALMSTSSCK